MEEIATYTIGRQAEQKAVTEQPDIMIFPFAHLARAANHSVDLKSLVWRPPAETPVKGQKILFEGLPYDIQYEVAKQLDYLSILRLTSTNRHFHQLIDPRTTLASLEVAEFVTERDRCNDNKYNNRFACYRCYKFLPKTKFSRTAMSRRDDDRYCFDCLAEMRYHTHLQPISNGKLNYYICHNCGTYGTRSTKCRGKRVYECNAEKDMIAEELALCTKKPPRQLARLEKVPTHILRTATKFLDYGDVIRLTQVSRTINEKVKLNWAPLHTRFQYTWDKWTADPDKNFQELEAFPCFMCFQFRPRTKFTSLQLQLTELHPATSWKLRCQSCLQQYGDSDNPLRIEFQRRRMCKICKCIKLGGTTCGGCLELYVKGAIDRETMYPAQARMKFDYQVYLNELDGIFDEDDDVDDFYSCISEL